MIHQVLNGLLPTGIIAAAASTISDNPFLSGIGETVSIVCVMGYFLWEKTKECRAMRDENKALSERLISHCRSCVLAKAANELIIKTSDK